MDTTPPTLGISLPSPISNTAQIRATFTWSEDVTGFINGDIGVNGGSKVANSFSGSGKEYELDIIPDGGQDVVVSVSANRAQDGAGNLGPPSRETGTATWQNVDTTPPDVSIGVPDEITNTDPFISTFTWTESVTGFTTGDIGVSGGSKGTFTGSGSSYELEITPDGNTDVTVRVSPLSVNDDANNRGPPAPGRSKTVRWVNVDRTPPDVTITGPAEITSTDPFISTFTWDESVTGFTTGDIGVSGGSKGTFTGSGSSYELEITPDGNENVVVRVSSNSAQDGASPPNTGPPTDRDKIFLWRTVDIIPPNVTITGPNEITNTDPFTATFTWTESVTGFTTDDIGVSGGSKGTFTGSGSSYELEITPDGNTDVTVRVSPLSVNDDANNRGPPAERDKTFPWRTVDTTPPDVSVTGPSSVSSTAEISITFTWTESVTGFESSDITVIGGTPGTLSGNGISYTLPVTPTGGVDVIVTVESGSAEDPANNRGPPADVSNTFPWVTLDNTPPDVTITVPSTISNTSAFPVTFAWSEPVIGFENSDVTVSGGTKNSFSGSGDSYSLEITPTGGTDVVVTVPASSVEDDANNQGPTVERSATISWVTVIIPTVSLSAPNTVDEGDAITITASLSEVLPSSIEIPLIIPDPSDDEYTLPSTSVISISANELSGTLEIQTNQDPDYENEALTVALGTLPSDINPGDPASVTITIVDDDSPPAPDIVAPNVLTVNEGSFAELDVSLTEEPIDNVIITINGLQGDLSSDENDLTFTPDTWNTNQSFTLRAAEDDADYDDETIILTLSASGGSSDVHTVTVTIDDNDIPDTTPPSVTIAGVPDNISDTNPFTVTFTFSEDVIDFVSGSVSLSGASKGTFTEVTLSEYILEVTPDGNVDVVVTVPANSVTDDSGNTGPQADVFEIALWDAITVTLSASPNPVNEGESVTITAELSENPDDDVVIPLDIIAGTAESSDYGDLSTSSITISGLGSGRTGSVDIQTFEDDGEYDDETFTVALGTLPPGISAGDPSSVEVTIEDNDIPPVPTVSLSADPLSVVEGGSVAIIATLSSELSTPVSIGLTETHITTEPADYEPVSGITIPSGELVGGVTLITNDDDIAETDETFLIGLGLLPPEVIYGDPRSVEITILDDGDVPPPSEVSLLVDPQEVEEGEAVTVELHLSQPLLIDVVIPLEYTSGTAESEDYIALDNVTIPAGENVASGQIMTIQDLDIDDEIFTVALGQLPSDVVGGRETSQTVTILDNFPRQASLYAKPNPVDEGAPVSITVTLNKPLPDDVIIPLVVTEGTATEQDYESTGLKQIEISAGETTGSYGIDVLQDNLVEDDETFMVSFGTLPNAIIPGDPASVEVRIVDNDMVGIDIPSAVSVLEGSSITVDLVLQSIPSDAVTLTLSGYAGTDLIVTPLSLRFPPDTWNQAQQVTLNASEDTDFSPDEVLLTISATGGDYTGVTNQIQVTIIDNDAPGINAPEFVTIEEGTTENISVSLATEPLDNVTVRLRETMDYLLLSPVTLTFSQSNWEIPQMVALTANEDDDLTDDRTDILISATGGGYDGTTGKISVTITDNDVPDIIAVSEVMMEEGGEYVYKVQLSAQPWDYVTIDLSGHDGTQLNLDRSVLNFNFDTWNVVQTVKLTALEDADFDDEKIELLLTASGGGYDNITHITHVTIEDNDRDSDNLSISIYDQQEPESNGTLKLQVELSWRTEETVTVQYKTSDIEAVAGSDYTQSNGIVIFSPGATRGTIVIDLTQDNLQEESERFEVTLSNPKNAIIARGTGVGTILDDDGSAYLRIDDALAEEVEGEIQFRVVLSQPQIQMVSVIYETQDGTAKAGEDYQASSGVVTIPPGVTETTITVPLLKNGIDWQEESFTVHLIASDEVKISKAVGVATIQETTDVSAEILEAYTARFIRTAASEVVDALENRFRSGRIASVCGAGERAELSKVWYTASAWEPSLGELLGGCQLSTTLNGESISLWGRGGFRRFNGQGVDEITIDGEVTTGMFGMDYRWKPGLLTGVLLVHSEGSGSFEVLEESGEVLAGVTSIYPYASYAGSDWEIWMSAGLGQGNAEVLELEGDLASRFGAMGIQGVLASGQLIRLDYQGDVLLTDARIKEHDVMAEVYRIRAGVEASAKLNEVFHPYISSNVRRDGGSAETGFGLELGGGIRINYPAWALRGEVKTQGLVMHTENSFSEWGMSGSLQIGLEAEGLMMRLRPSWGHRNSMSILSQQTIWNVAAAGPNAHQIEMEIGYGIPWKKGTARSVMGMTRLSQGAMYRLGGELRPLDKFRISVFGITHAQDPGRIGLNVQSTLQY